MGNTQTQMILMNFTYVSIPYKNIIANPSKFYQKQKNASNFLKDNGSLNIATDSQPYLLNILYLITHLKKQYIWENQRKLDWDYQNISLVQTKYYKKAIKNGSNPFFIKLRKL